MRVDWCVSSWFRIKNTDSLTQHTYNLLEKESKRPRGQPGAAYTYMTVSSHLIDTLIVTHHETYALAAPCRTPPRERTGAGASGTRPRGSRRRRLASS